MKGIMARKNIIQRALQQVAINQDVLPKAESIEIRNCLIIEGAVAMTDALMLAGPDAERYAELIDTNEHLRTERPWWQ